MVNGFTELEQKCLKVATQKNASVLSDNAIMQLSVHVEAETCNAFYVGLTKGYKSIELL